MVNGFGITIYDKAAAMGTRHRGQGSLVAFVPQVGGQFRFDVDATGKCGRLRDECRGRKRHISLSTISNEHTYTDTMEPEEPKTQQILERIPSTLTINQPLIPADSQSNDGRSSGGFAVGQKTDCAGSSDQNEYHEDESEDEDQSDPPVVINKSKKSSFTRELAGLNGNLRTASEAPAGSHWRKCRTDHRCRRCG